MLKRHLQQFMVGLLSAAMAVTTSVPVTALADDAVQESQNTEETAVTETEQETGMPETQTPESGNTQTETAQSNAAKAAAADETMQSEEETNETENEVPAHTSVTSYDLFLSDLKVLTDYANTYVQTHTDKTANALIINYIRTGVEKYTTDSWKIMAGAENTDFVNYVAEQDKANGTYASALRNIETFKLNHAELTNGEEVDFNHMFGMMDIASYNGDVESATADMGGWAGDLVDLVTYVHKHCDTVSNYSDDNIDEFADLVENNYLHLDVDGEDSFGDLDIRADLDGYYLMKNIAGGSSLYDVCRTYFTEDLTEANRAAYFLNNKFAGKTTKDDIRSAMLSSYESNKGCTLLEADRSLNSLSELETLRKGSVYALADYLYGKAGGMLNPGTDPEDPDTPDEPDTPVSNEFYTVFSNSQSTLAPGVTQNIEYATTADNKQIVYYLATADLNNEDVHVCANYGENDGSQAAAGKMTRVSDQMAAAQTRHSNPDDPDNYIENYNPIAGINADFYNMSTGVPSGILIMEGKVYNESYANNFFGITKDGTPVIGDAAELKTTYKDKMQEAVGGGIMLVKDGKSTVHTSDNYYNNRASRTAVGITADNKVVFMVLDGRQEPFSAGGSAEEMAQIMLDAGCVEALGLDGGGSSTFVAKEEGSDTCSVVNRPSDGYERSVSSSLMIVTTGKTTNEFDHAVISSDKDYLTVGTSIDLSVAGVSSTGNTSDLPEDLTLQVSDPTIGTLSDKTLLNGITDVNGTKMYYINGVPAPMGMIEVDGDTYYVTSKGVVVTGSSYYCSLLRTEEEKADFPVITTAYKEGTYTFDEEGRMVKPDTAKNGIYSEDGSLYYYKDGKRTYGGVMQIDGKYYYAATSGEIVHAQPGQTRKYWISKTNGLVEEKSYEFDENGVMTVPDTSKNGIYSEDGSLYYYKDGVRTYGGVMKIDGKYYYAATSGEIVHAQAGQTRKYWISKTNDLLAERSYTFDENGVMTDAVDKKDTSVNGIVAEDGSLYYYKDGLRYYAGVFEQDGKLYYAATSGEIVHAQAGQTRKYWISKTNGLLKEKSYTFDENGVILDGN